MGDWDRRRTQSTASYFPSPVATHNEGTFLDDLSCRDPSFDLPRLTEEEVAEIIAEGPAIRKRMERHKIDVEFVLECNTMLLEWVAMRERLLRQWARVPAELVVPPATTVSRDTPLPTPPPSAGLPMIPRRQSSLSSLPPLGALLQRKRSRGLRNRATEVIAKNQIVAGLSKRIKPRRKDCSCACTCGAAQTPSTPLKFDDDAVVVIDLHAELLRYDELLRGLKERFDDRELAGEEQDDEGRYSPSFQDVPYDDAYEADEESLQSPVVEQMPRGPPPRMPPHPRYPWRIPEASEPGSDDEDTRGADDGTKASSGPTETDMATHSDTETVTETEADDASSIRTATRESSVPPSPSPATPSTFVLDRPLTLTNTISSSGTHETRGTHGSNRTMGVLSAVMQMDARSILGSEYTGDTFGLRSYTSSAGDYGSLNNRSVGSFQVNGDSYRTNLSHVDQEFSVLLDKLFVFDESVLDIGVREGQTKEERERAVGGAGRAVRVANDMNDMRSRTVTEFGVRTRSVTAPVTSTPFPTPTGSAEGCLHPTMMQHSASAMASIPSLSSANLQPQTPASTHHVALGGMTIHTFTAKGHDDELDNFHPMEQFADASTLGSR